MHDVVVVASTHGLANFEHFWLKTIHFCFNFLLNFLLYDCVYVNLTSSQALHTLRWVSFFAGQAFYRLTFGFYSRFFLALIHDKGLSQRRIIVEKSFELLILLFFFVVIALILTINIVISQLFQDVRAPTFIHFNVWLFIVLQFFLYLWLYAAVISKFVSWTLWNKLVDSQVQCLLILF